ncbi:hypothetical protein WJX84_004013 [Apatococcus fuscideae]|uniref:F-box domain-containing protein n=1 Tax=Apatococcus fuscideae TaxID=2026836 RepID=A0AAW1T0K9_9CHLO
MIEKYSEAASQPWSAANFKPNTLRSKAVPAPGTMSETRKAPAATLTHNTLQQPLRSYMLPHLSPQSLTALRQACQTTQILVDDHTAKMWTRHALRLGIPPQLLPRDSSNAHAVYTLLHQRATLISRIRHWEPTSTLDVGPRQRCLGHPSWHNCPGTGTTSSRCHIEAALWANDLHS